MLETAAATWLNTNLAGFDHLFLSIQHIFAEKAGGVLTPIMKAITFIGEKGWPFFLLAFVFMLMASKRDLGVCIFGAVCCGALITNVILKDNVARLRPFENSIEYELWWMAVGSPPEEGFSFPSGHVTACAAGMTAITMMRGKKWIVPSVLAVLLMAISRNYLMAHYPSDVVAAAIIGVFSGIVAWFITQLIFRFLRRKRHRVPFFRFLLHFDIRDFLPFLRRKGRDETAPRSRRPAPAPVEKAEEDVKTYRGGRQSAKAETPAPAPKAEAAPAKRAEAPARSGGRHTLPEGTKSARPRASGSYQGKH